MRREVAERRPIASSPDAVSRCPDHPSITLQNAPRLSSERVPSPNMDVGETSDNTADRSSASETAATTGPDERTIIEEDDWKTSHVAKRQFYVLLLRYIMGQPPPILRRLLDLHHAYPHLQSTESYNLIINFSMRRTAWAISKRVYNAMLQVGFRPNMYTWRLRVRMLTLIGDTQSAFECALAGIGDIGPPPSGKIPPLVWFELFWHPAPIRDNALVVEGDKATLEKRAWAIAARHETQMPVSERFSRYFDPAIMPDLSQGSFRPHLIARCVRFLAAHTEPLQSELAERLTRSYLKSLPPKLTRAQRLGAIFVINQNFHVHLGRHSRSTYHPRPVANALPGVRTHIRHRALCEDLLRIHRGVSPNTETVRLLLGSLRGINIERAVKYAKRLVKDFEYKWGKHDVIDLSVRRILAKMAHRFRHQRVFTRKTILQTDKSMAVSRMIVKQWERPVPSSTAGKSRTRGASETEDLATRLLLRHRALVAAPSGTEFGPRGLGSSERSKYFRFRGKAEVHGLVHSPEMPK
ncbi:hypothetical protein BS47DRAFT_649903 [Hydnum rufescens UP504]|uniref:Uncharacterized protein n=1 Tax=Hydnum rufescens UP504 TaxID=1448309 RepID=A0A9P6BAW6_9AGAM|nr:hypothetical protein BS47DRAFT_649903 [Hydnum rufescens UP504]